MRKFGVPAVPDVSPGRGQCAPIGMAYRAHLTNAFGSATEPQSLFEKFMQASRSHALAQAKRLSRTLASSPLPHRQAQEVFSELVRAEGWNTAEQAQIVAFGTWLGSRPPPSALKDQCQMLIKRLQAA